MNLDTTEVVKAEAETQIIDYAAKKRGVVFMLLAYSAILGVIACFLPEDGSPLNFIVSLPMLILGVSWCYLDAAERGVRIGGLMKWMLVLLFIVGLPIYIFQTRGVRGFQTNALALLLVGAMVACMFATAYLTLFVLFWGDGMGLWELSA